MVYINNITLKETSPEWAIPGKKAVSALPYVCEPGFLACPLHWHEFMEISRVTKGTFHFKRGNDDIVLKEGDVVICCPEQLHYGVAGDEGVSYFTIKFDVESLFNQTKASPMYLASLMNFTTVFEPKTNDPEIVKVLDEIYDLNKTEANPLAIIGRLYMLIGLFYDRCLASYKIPSQADIKFAEVLKYVNEHFLDKISSKSVSKMFNYNESYFCRKFKNVTGTTIMNYVLISRLDYAKTLLNESKEDISTIAAKSGFSDVAYFYRSFKKQYKYTPSEYRKQTNQNKK